MSEERGPETGNGDFRADLALWSRDDPDVLLASAFADCNPLAVAYALALTSAIHGSEITTLNYGR